jgi:hypothetical protein
MSQLDPRRCFCQIWQNGLLCTVFMQYCTFTADNLQTKLKLYFLRLHGATFIKVFLVSILWNLWLIWFGFNLNIKPLFKFSSFLSLKSCSFRLVLFIVHQTFNGKTTPIFFLYSLSVSKLFLLALIYGFQFSHGSHTCSGLLKNDLNARIFFTINLFRTAKPNWGKKSPPSPNHQSL